MNTQQDTLYLAERVLPSGNEFASIREVQSYVDSLTDSWWWTAFYADKVERVMVDTTSDSTSYAVLNILDMDDTIGEIALTQTQMTTRVISHELAHIFAHRLHGSLGHDPWFARERLVTAYTMLGSSAYTDLYASFIREGVEVAGGVHTLTDERIVL